MAFFEFPHTRTYDSDLGWLINAFNDISKKLDQYLENAVITFADPITWSIVEQYTALTVVIDSDGTAYLSKQPVPAGVDISDTDYWLPIFNYDDSINTLRSQIAYNAGDSPTISVDLAEGDLVFWEGLIYHTLMDMPAGTAMIEGSNVERYTVDEKINTLIGSDIAQIKTEIININNEIAGLDLKTPWYMPEQYGAVADGVTDCTAAFTAMLADMPEGGIAILTGMDYYLSGRISIDKHDTHIIGLGRGEFTPRLMTDLIDGNFITVNNYGCVFDSIELKGPGYSSSGDFTLMYFDSTNTSGNVDSLLDKCCFADCHRGIAVSGRNLRVTNSLFSACAIGVEFLTCAAGDERGHVIQGNRMHLCGTSVKNAISSSSAHKAVYIADNFHDYGGCFFSGYCEGVTIIGNYIRNYGFGTSYTTILLTPDPLTTSTLLACVKNNVISGDSIANSGIFVQAGARVSINGNTIENCKQNGIGVEAGSEVYITDNIVKNCGQQSGTHNMSIGAGKGAVANNVSINETIAGGSGMTVQNNISVTI